MEDPVEERKEQLRDAAAADTEELKEALEEFSAAAENGTQEAVKISRWVFLVAAFLLGVLSGRRKGRYLSVESLSNGR
jgi:F0F1-type ATP synthase assembly protein I